MQTKHSHGEAFRHMTYIGVGPNKYIKITIWNSRDGVTPFTTYCKEYGIHLQHVNWQNDIYNPAYKPKKGDLVWVSYDEATARKHAEESYTFHCAHLEEVRKMTPEAVVEKFGYDQRGQLESWLADKEKYVNEAMHNMLEAHGEPQPLLVLVEEDWK